MGRVRKIKWKWMLPVLSMVFTLFIFRYILLIGYVPTESMEPTLKKGSYIIGSRIYTELEVGDIIVFWHDGKLLVKRIAAVAGESVERKGEVLIVPEECYYMLGDNSRNSYDSRYWEEIFVGRISIIAKVLT